MAIDPQRSRPASGDKSRPKIWADGDQRPPFNLRAFGRASLYLARLGVASLQAWAARTARRVAVNVKNGAGRIPEDKLGRAARFVPSHLRVAGWIKNLAAVFAHASASADPDVKRGNALVIEIEPHLWDTADLSPDTAAGAAAPTASPTPASPTPASPTPASPTPAETAPVVLAEPMPVRNADPLAAIRAELGAAGPGGATGDKPGQTAHALIPATPPLPPGEAATGAIQVFGYMLGWLGSFAALPYGLAKAGFLHVKGVDLRRIGQDD